MKSPSVTCSLLLALACLPACEGKKGSERAALNEAAPRVTGKTLEGEYVALGDHAGKVVLLNVWATWCKPCRQELPELERLHRELGPEGLQVLAFSVDSPRAEPQVRKLAADLKLTFPIVLDPANSSVKAYGVNGYPTSFIIGRDGQIRWRRDGMIRKGDEELAEQLRAALAAPVPGAAQ